MPQIKHLFPKIGGVIAFLASTLAVSGPASALQNFGINWTGINGYTLEGSFSYANSLDNTGAITFAALTPNSFTFTTFLNGNPLNTATTASNFNFNTTTKQFLVGGISSGITGQLWGSQAVGAGFFSGSGTQGISNNATNFGTIPIANSTLTATPLAPVPFEFSPAVGSTVVGGLFLVKRLIKNRKAS